MFPRAAPSLHIHDIRKVTRQLGYLPLNIVAIGAFDPSPEPTIQAKLCNVSPSSQVSVTEDLQKLQILPSPHVASCDASVDGEVPMPSQADALSRNPTVAVLYPLSLNKPERQDRSPFAMRVRKGYSKPVQHFTTMDPKEVPEDRMLSSPASHNQTSCVSSVFPGADEPGSVLDHHSASDQQLPPKGDAAASVRPAVLPFESEVGVLTDDAFPERPDIPSSCSSDNKLLKQKREYIYISHGCHSRRHFGCLVQFYMHACVPLKRKAGYLAWMID